MIRFSILALLICSCAAPKGDHSESDDQRQFETTLFKSEYGGFGYDISVDGKLVIHQPVVPAVTGNRGFETKEKAGIVAGIVVKKLKANEMPPTVTVEEVLKQIN